MKTLISVVLGPAIVAVTLAVVTTTAQADVTVAVPSVCKS